MKTKSPIYVIGLVILVMAFSLMEVRCLPRQGGLTLTLVDDPVEEVSEVQIKISSIVFHTGAAEGEDDEAGVPGEGKDTEGENGKVELPLTAVTDDYINLLDLQNGFFADLVNAEIPAGIYGNMHIELEDARIVVEEGDEPQPLTVPPDKLIVPLHGLTVTPREVTELFLVFDVRQSLLENPQGYRLKPVLRAVSKVVSGSISGTVDPLPAMDSETGDGMIVAVYAVPPGGEIGDAETSTQPTDQGDFTLVPVLEGTYDVIAAYTQVAGGEEQATEEVRVTDVEVTAEQDTDRLDLSLPLL